MAEPIQEASVGEHQSLFPADPECSSVGAQPVASRICLCTQKTQIFVSTPEHGKCFVHLVKTVNALEIGISILVILDEVYCTAIDSIDGKLVGCNNVVDTEESSLLRPSTRVPYITLCKVHYNRMLRHNCCPTCGLFCTQVNTNIL